MDYRECSKVFKALADPKRLEIIDLLSCGEECACKIQERFDVTQPTMSHDLKVLIDANILTARNEGKWKHYKLNGDFLEEFKSCFSEITREKRAVTEENRRIKMDYYVLGGGCAKCNTLTDNLKEALDELKIDAQVKHVTDTVEIMGMGVMSTPALVMGDKVLSKGRVLSTNEIKKLIAENSNV